MLLLLVCLVLDVLLQIRERIMWHAQRVEGNGSHGIRINQLDSTALSAWTNGLLNYGPSTTTRVE